MKAPRRTARTPNKNVGVSLSRGDASDVVDCAGQMRVGSVDDGLILEAAKTSVESVDNELIMEAVKMLRR